MSHIDDWAYRSRWRDTAPGYKASLALCSMAVCLCSPSPICHLLAVISMGSLSVAGGVPTGRYLRMLLPLMLLLTFGVLGILLQLGWRMPEPSGIRLGSLHLYATAAGAARAAQVFLRSLACMSCLLFLILSTPVRDLCALLARLGVPGILVEQLGLIYRFIFLLKDTAALKGKSARARQGLRRPQGLLRTLGMLWGTVFVQSMGRGKAVYTSMRARGYRQPGALPSLRRYHPVTGRAVVLAALLPLLLLASNLL